MEHTSKSQFLLYLDWSLLALAFLVLVGWQLDIVVLKSFTADLTAMNPLTAITFMVAAFWLLQYTNHKKHPVSLLAGLFILLVGLIHNTSYLFQMDGIRFDDFLFQTKVETSGINSHTDDSCANDSLYTFTYLIAYKISVPFSMEAI